MTISRRRLLAASAAAPLAAPWIAGTARAEAKQLKISHQFPGGTIDSGDFRDQLCRHFAAAADLVPASTLPFRGSLGRKWSVRRANTVPTSTQVRGTRRPELPHV